MVPTRTKKGIPGKRGKSLHVNKIAWVYTGILWSTQRDAYATLIQQCQTFVGKQTVALRHCDTVNRRRSVALRVVPYTQQ